MPLAVFHNHVLHEVKRLQDELVSICLFGMILKKYMQRNMFDTTKQLST